MSIRNLIGYDLAQEPTLQEILDTLQGDIDVSLNLDLSFSSIIRDISMVDQTTDVNTRVLNDVSVNIINQPIDVSANVVLDNIVISDFSMINQTTDVNTRVLNDVSVNIINQPIDISINNIVDVSVNNLVNCNINSINNIPNSDAVGNGVANNRCLRVCIANNNSDIAVVSGNSDLSCNITNLVDVSANITNELLDVSANISNIVDVSVNNLVNVSTNINYLRALQGVNDPLVSGMRSINFRGYKKNIGDNTINWSDVADGLPVIGTLILPPLSGVATFDVVSSSVNDALAGSGAEIILITHSDIDGNIFNTSVFMTGITPVNVVVNASECVRFIGAQVIQTGILNQNQGTIDIYATGSPGGFNDYLCIPAGGNITAQCALYVPRGLTFYGRTANIQLSTLANDDCEIRLLIKASDTNIWKTLNEQLINGNSDENYNLDIRGFSISNTQLGGNGTDGIDIKLQAIKLQNGGRFSVSASFFGYAF